jgi:hypothetical protein
VRVHAFTGLASAHAWTDDSLHYDSKVYFPPIFGRLGYHPSTNVVDPPDFIAMPQKLYDELTAKDVTYGAAWHHLTSVGQWRRRKSLSADNLLQLAGYAGSHNQARPDRSGVLVFSACKGCYVIGYSDPSIWMTTKPVEWDNLVPLIAYIHSLHFPHLQDPTIRLHNHLSWLPHWIIRDEALRIDDIFKIIHIGRPHSRMTTIFQRVGTVSCAPLIVKDSWVKQHRTAERALFKSLVKNGEPPGWVGTRLPADDVATEPLQTPKLAFIERLRKDRTVMENTGRGFYECESLSEAIAVTYDILEGKSQWPWLDGRNLMFSKAGRWAITKRRILHHDISPGNILIRPVVGSKPRDGVCFIEGIYEGYVGFQSVGVLCV